MVTRSKEDEELEDLHLRPSEVDINLETSITKWERSIHDYRVCEDATVESEDSEEVIDVLERLREMPEEFLSHSNEAIRTLATKRCLIYSWQKKLGLSRQPTEMATVVDTTTRNPVVLATTSQAQATAPVSSTTQTPARAGAPVDISGKTSRKAANYASFTSSSRRGLIPDEEGVAGGGGREGVSRMRGAGGAYVSTRHKAMIPADPLLSISLSALQNLSSDASYEENKNKQVFKSAKKSRGGSGRDRDDVDDDSSTSNRFTKQLSITWAGRLESIDATQGTIKMQASSSDHSTQFSSPKIRPKWPHFLVDVWFDVIKKNRFGKTARRVIKLTEYHILNIKGGNAIAKVYLYMQIAKIWLENPTTLFIVLKDNKKLIYISPMAPSIVQQITTRVQVRIALEKTFFSFDTSPFQPASGNGHHQANGNQDVTNGGAGLSIGHSYAATQRMIEAISEENDAGASEVMASFAQNLVSAVRGRDASKSMSSSDEDGAKGLKIGKGTDSLVDDEERIRASSTISSNTDTSHRAKKLFAFTEGSGEYKVHAEVTKAIFDAQTSEGNTRKVFIESFVSSQKTLLDVRHCIDALHEYILTQRGLQLALLLLSSEGNTPSSSSSSSSSSGGGGGGGSGSSSIFFTPSKAAAPPNKQPARNSIRGISDILDLSHVDEASLAALSYIVFSVVEEAVFLPLKDNILALLPSAKSGEDDVLVPKMHSMRGKSQADWQIDPDLISPLGWESAIFELSGVERASTPSMQLHALVRTTKAIYAEYKNAILPTLLARGVTDYSLGADTLVPIFIFVTCQAALKRPILSRDLMWGLCHPDQLHGEAGYCLTVFESSLEFISEASFEELPVKVSFSLSTSFDKRQEQEEEGVEEKEEGKKIQLRGSSRSDDIPPPAVSFSGILGRSISEETKGNKDRGEGEGTTRRRTQTMSSLVMSVFSSFRPSVSSSLVSSPSPATTPISHSSSTHGAGNSTKMMRESFA